MLGIKKNGKWKVVLLVLSILLVLTGCVGSKGSNDSSGGQSGGQQTSSPGGQTGQTGGDGAGKVIRVGVGSSLSTGDPHMTGSPADMAVLINIFDPLVRRDATGKLQPSLAVSWEIVGDKTWEFKLREGVKFHNGEEFNAESVKFSLERVFKEGSKSPIQELRSFESVEVVDSHTVRIHTSTVDPYVPDKLALFAGMMVPPNYIQEKGEEYFHSNPVGTGPFIFESWVKDGSLKLKANPDYWGGAPKAAEVEFKFIHDAQARVAALLSGDVDVINSVPATAINSIESNPNLRLDKAEGIRIYYLSTAYTSGPTQDKRVRQAISYAVDTQLLIDKLMGGYAVQIAAPIATSNFGADVDLKPYPYDPQKAKQLLAEAGYPNGFEIEMNTQPGIYTDIAQAIVQMLADVGIKVNLKPLPAAEFEDKYQSGQLAPLWNSGYSVWQGDPTTLISTFFVTGMPRAKYFSDELDQKINDMKQMTDVEQRKKALHEILKILHEDAPWVYLFQGNDLYGVSKNVTWNVPYDQLLEMKTASIQ